MHYSLWKRDEWHKAYFSYSMEAHVCNLQKSGVWVESLSLVCHFLRCHTEALGKRCRVPHSASVRSRITPGCHICPKPLPKVCWFFLPCVNPTNPSPFGEVNRLTPLFGAQWIYWSLLELFFTEGIILLWRLNDEPLDLKTVIIK